MENYYDLLTQCPLESLQFCEAEYFHGMNDYQDIHNWVKGTALHQVLSAMDTTQQQQFNKLYLDAISIEYSRQ